MASSIPLAGLEVAARTLARIALSAALVAGASLVSAGSLAAAIDELTRDKRGAEHTGNLQRGDVGARQGRDARPHNH